MGCTENAVEPWGKSLEELTRNIEWFKEALELPVLTLADIPTPPEKLEQNRDRGGKISHDRLIAELGLSEPSPAN